MQYRLAYDVLNDGPPWFGLAFASLLLLFAVAPLLEILERVCGRRHSPTPGRPGDLAMVPFAVVIVLFLSIGCLGVFMASYTFEAFVQRKHCQEWVRSAQYDDTEGTVTDYQYRKAGPRFRVAGLSFDLLNGSAGFTGRFNGPGAADGELCDGLRIRLAHQAGFILRVEIASEPGAAADRRCD
jgi:hypothetical protein